MIQHIWSVLCERISTDQISNLISYLTCIEEITVSQMPIVIPHLALGSQWITNLPTKDMLELKLLLISPEGIEKQLIVTKSLKFDKERTRTNVLLNGIKFESCGTYSFKIQMKVKDTWQTIGEIPLKIRMKEKSEIELKTNSLK